MVPAAKFNVVFKIAALRQAFAIFSLKGKGLKYILPNK